MAVTIRLAKLLVPVEGDTSGLEGSLRGAKGLVSRFSGSVKRIGGLALKGMAVGLGAAAAGTTALAGAAAKLAIDAAPLEQVEAAFEGLAESAGRGKDEMLAALQESSAGMISNRDLMLSFNEAAQLVSVDFASKLPDAMDALGKVSAATGKDLNFLLDSLVVGVGRLSPMILDNLGITVDLSEAYEDWARSQGVADSELSGFVKTMTKAQQQEALMDQVLTRLADNTAAMPDITGSAAAGIASLGATFQNAKDSIGKAFVPALGTILEAITPLIDKYLPKLIGFIETRVGPAFQAAATFVGEFLGSLGDVSPLEALYNAVNEAFGSEVWEQVERVIDAVQRFITQVEAVVAVVEPYLQMAWDWISANVELQDVLIALAAVVMAVVVPAIVSVVTSAAPILLVIGAIIAVVALLRKAWEENFLGIRDIAAQAMEWLAQNIPPIIEVVRAAFEQVVAWLQENVPPIWQRIQEVAASLFNWLSDNATPVLQVLHGWWQTFINFLRENGPPLFEKVKEVFSVLIMWIAENAPPAIEAVREVLGWLVDRFKVFVGFLRENIIPLFRAIVNVWLASLKTGFKALGAVWTNIIVPALKDIAKWIGDHVGPAIKSLGDAVGKDGPIGKAFTWFKDNILNPLIGAFEGLSGVIQDIIGWLEDLAAKISEAGDNLPDWMVPGSPTPLELGLRGIRDELTRLARMDMPELALQASLVPKLEPFGGGGFPGAEQGKYIGDTYNMHVEDRLSAALVRDLIERNRRSRLMRSAGLGG